jgi:hypothetical protein
MLAMKNQHGEVEASIPGLAKFAHVSIESTEKALAKLMAPDQYSRTKEFEGRRIEEIDGGWLVLNHAKYKNKASEDDEREKTRLRVQRFRERNGENSVTPPVTPCNALVTPGNAGNDIQIQKQIQIQKEKKKEPDGSLSLKRVLTDGWISAYKEFFGMDYKFRGAVDGKAADRLLATGIQPAEIIQIAQKAWAQENSKTHWACVNQGRELAKFDSAFNSIRQELNRRSNQTARQISETREQIQCPVEYRGGPK